MLLLEAGKECRLSIYTEYFGFHGDPFADTADPDFFYTNPTYQKAHATLLTGIREYKGFLLLTGETGTGKTTLLRRLMKDIEASGHSVFFDSTSLASATIDDLLYFICAELGLHGDDDGRVAKLRMFSAYLNALVNKGGTGVLLVDEAHHLNDEVLGGLRLISPLDMKSERLLLQIVLVGQPELERRLEQPKLRPIYQRVASRCRLGRLKGEEVSAYIFHRLQTAGCERHDLFAAEALQRLAHFSHGVPRLINIICDNALLLAYGERSKTVSAQLVNEAVANLRIDQLTNAAPLSGADLPSADSPAIPVSVPSGTPLLPQPREHAGEDGDAAASTTRSRGGGYLAFGLLLALGIEWFLRGQRNVPFSIFPSQASVISRVTPAVEGRQPLVLPEGQRQLFTVEASSRQPEVFQYVWLVDGKEEGTGARWTYQPQFTEGGQEKTITVRVRHPTMQGEERSWKVSIQEVNRPPRIATVEPKRQLVNIQKGEEQHFVIAMTDPDLDDRPTAVWTLDGKEIAQGQTWTFTPPSNAKSAQHVVAVSVADQSGLKVEKQWQVAVNDPVLRPPLVKDADGNARILRKPQ